nr:phytanoyl-CoA dioxygenase family protein [Paraburkholderia caffeinitolerans]
MVNWSAYFRAHLLDHRRLLEYVDPFMLKTSDSYWLSTSQLIELQPGEKVQLLHRDGDNYPAFRQFGASAPEIMMNCLIAPSEYTEEMGATRVIPSSNKWEDWSRPVTQADTIAAVMEKGDAFFSGKVIHGGGANVSNKPRRELAMAYCPRWLMPEEAYPFQVPIEMARTLSPRAQQLIGFRSFHNQTLEGGSLWQLNYEELGSFLKLDE